MRLERYHSPRRQMPHKFDLHQAVILEVDLPGDDLLRGRMGVVLDLVEPDVVIVQFFDANRVSMDLVSVLESCLRPETNEERAGRLTPPRPGGPRQPEL